MKKGTSLLTLSLLIAFSASPNVKAASAASNDSLAGSTTNCATALQSEFNSLTLGNARKQSLDLINKRQAAAAKLANTRDSGQEGRSAVYKLYSPDKNKNLKKLLDTIKGSERQVAGKLMSDRREQIAAKIGSKGDSGQSLQGVLTDYKAKAKNASSKDQLIGQTCSMIAETRVYSFWPEYVKTTYTADFYAVYQLQLGSRLNSTKATLDKNKALGANSKLREKQQVAQTSLSAAKSSLQTATASINSLNPSSMGATTDGEAYFQPHKAQLAEISTQNNTAKQQLNSLLADTRQAVTDAKSQKSKTVKKSKPLAKIALDNPKLPPNFDKNKKNKFGYYQLPKSPNNELYYIYGYDSRTGDGSSTQPHQRYGKSSLIRVFYSVAVNFNLQYPEAKLVAGDLNAIAGHASHKTGVDIDIYAHDRLAADMRAPYKNAKSTERTIALGKMLMDTKKIDIIFYNDPQVISAVNAYARNNNLPGSVQASNSSHEFHMHVRLKESSGPYDSCAVVGNAPAGCFPAIENDPPTDGSGNSSD